MFPKLRLRGIVPEGEPSPAGGPVGTTLGVLIATIGLSIMLIAPSPSTWVVPRRWSEPTMTFTASRDLQPYPVAAPGGHAE